MLRLKNQKRIKKQKGKMKNKILIIPLILAVLLLPVFALADMGAHPEAKFSVAIDGKPFNNALVSLQECGQDKRYFNSDYSIAGLGTATSLFLDDNFFNFLEPDESGNYPSKEELESLYEFKITWSNEQLAQARNFVLDEFDKQKQCYWQPGERTFTDCENATCKVTYRVPSSFRIKLLDLETGKIYITQDIKRKGLNTLFSVNFNSTTGQEYIGKLVAKQEANISFAAIIFPLVFIINLMIELLAAIALAYFAFKIKIKKIILPVLLGNLVTHPLAYFAPLLFDFNSAFMIALGIDLIILGSEAFAVLFEAFLITRMAKVQWGKAVILSFIVNLISLFIGAFMPFIGV